MPLCIWVDCDEVLSETINELLKRSPLKEKWIQRSDILSYDLFEVEKIWLSKEETIQAFYSFFESPEYYQAQPVSWAYEKLYERKQAWHTLFVVTARKQPHEFFQIICSWIYIQKTRYQNLSYVRKNESKF